MDLYVCHRNQKLAINGIINKMGIGTSKEAWLQKEAWPQNFCLVRHRDRVRLDHINNWPVQHAWSTKISNATKVLFGPSRNQTGYYTVSELATYRKLRQKADLRFSKYHLFRAIGLCYRLSTPPSSSKYLLQKSLDTNPCLLTCSLIRQYNVTTHSSVCTFFLSS